MNKLGKGLGADHMYSLEELAAWRVESINKLAEREKRIKELEEKIRNLEAHGYDEGYNNCKESTKDFYEGWAKGFEERVSSKIQKLEAQIAEKLADLDRYGQHIWGCKYDDSGENHLCTCGLKQALKSDGSQLLNAIQVAVKALRWAEARLDVRNQREFMGDPDWDKIPTKLAIEPLKPYAGKSNG